MNYYNENDPKAAEWLRELIAGGFIPAGEVDERSIVDVRGADLDGFTQCHFFAGIGGWSLALALAEWPASREVWTGSCPCQPFSAAGKGLGEKDPRHLWPQFRRLIAEREPATVIGEQVASKAGRQWLAGIRDELEALDYAVGAADLCAAGAGAPHIRQRLFWVAYSCGQRFESGSGIDRDQIGEGLSGDEPESDSLAFGLANSNGQRFAGRAQQRRKQIESEQPTSHGNNTSGCRSSVGLADTNQIGRERLPLGLLGEGDQNYWAGFDILPCTDGKARRIEPGTFPLANGIPGRVGLLRGYGNAIVPEIAAEFIAAFLEA